MTERVNNLNKHFFKSSKFVTRCVSGETIIVPVRSNVGDLNSIYTLNDLGTRIWDLIDGQSNVKQIIETIVEEYDVKEEEATKDINEYIESLEAVGLIGSSEAS